ncbi:MAG: dihydroneopterin aldolase [Nitrososphaeria archaeon]
MIKLINEMITSIKGLTVYCIIGANSWERNIKQKVIIDINLWVDASEAIYSDRLENTLDYKKLKDKVLSFVQSSSYHLIEALAYNVANMCLQEDKVKMVRVKVSKPGALSYAREAAFEIVLKK